MATPTRQIKKRYPIPVYNYRVTIVALPLSSLSELSDLPPTEGEFHQIGCSAVLGLNMENEIVEYRHGYSFLTGQQLVTANSKSVKLSILKGVTIKGSYLSDWMKSPHPKELPHKRTIVIDLCNESGEPVIRWGVFNAIPLSLEAPSFDANSSEAAFERLDLVAQKLEVKYL